MILVHKGFSCFSVWALKVKVSFSGWSKSFMVWPAVATNLEFVSLLDLPFQLKLFDRCHFFSPLFHGCLSLPLFLASSDAFGICEPSFGRPILAESSKSHLGSLGQSSVTTTRAAGTEI